MRKIKKLLSEIFERISQLRYTYEDTKETKRISWCRVCLHNEQHPSKLMWQHGTISGHLEVCLKMGAANWNFMVWNRNFRIKIAVTGANQPSFWYTHISYCWLINPTCLLILSHEIPWYAKKSPCFTEVWLFICHSPADSPGNQQR